MAGVDEAGRGALAGPVTAAAVVLPPDSGLLGVDDSKRLDEAERERLFDRIVACADALAVALCHAHMSHTLTRMRPAKGLLHATRRSRRGRLR